MSKQRIIILVIVTAVAILLGSAMVYYRATFPYGESHCCIIAMSFALEKYAEEDGGRYPAGEASSEASLSLLYKSNYIDPYTLRGMTVPEKTTRRILEGGGLLGPESCGWQYVPGLTFADDPGLALLWCKSALGHNGQRTKDGGRQVVFIGSGIDWIPGDKWPAFLQEQKELLKHRSAKAVGGVPLLTGVIELPDGTRIDRFDGSCTLKEQSKGPNSSSSGTSSGGFNRSQLVWYHAPLQDGYVTRTLSFSNLISDPVTITFTNGVPDVTNFVFRMRSTR
jgi:hypothetical protein